MIVTPRPKLSGHKSPIEMQDDMLLTLLEASTDQLFGKFNYGTGVTKKSKKDLWHNVSKTLNSIEGGGQKTSDQWEQYYKDRRNKARAEASRILKYVCQTGGDVPLNNFLEDFDVRILVLSKIGSFAPLEGALDSNKTSLEEVAARHGDGLLVHPDEIPDSLLYELLKTGSAVQSVGKNGIRCIIMPQVSKTQSRRTSSGHLLHPILSSPASTVPNHCVTSMNPAASMITANSSNSNMEASSANRPPSMMKTTWASSFNAGVNNLTTTTKKPSINQQPSSVLTLTSGSSDDEDNAPIMLSTLPVMQGKSLHRSTSPKRRPTIFAAQLEKSPPPATINTEVQSTPGTPLDDLSALAKAVPKAEHKRLKFDSASREVEKTPPRSKAYTRRPPAKSKDAAALAEQRQEMMKTMSRMAAAAEKQNELKEQENSIRMQELQYKKSQLKRKRGSSSDD